MIVGVIGSFITLEDFVNIQRIKMNKLYFYGMSRSGTHAIVKWVLYNFCQEADLNIDKIDILRPYPNMQAFINKSQTLLFANNFDTSLYDSLINYICNNRSELQTLVLLYENREYNYDSYNYLIIRDFLNLLCSRIKQIKNFKVDTNRIDNKIFYEKFITIWIQNARFIKSENTIIYNKWIQSKEYRDEMSERFFHLKNLDYLDYKQPFGGGSSFIGRNKESNITNYLNRFSLIDIPDAGKEIILSNSELLDINEEYFNINIKKIL